MCRKDATDQRASHDSSALDEHERADVGGHLREERGRMERGRA